MSLNTHIDEITAKRDALSRLLKTLTDIRTKLSPWIRDVIADDDSEGDSDLEISLGLSNGLNLMLTIDIDGGAVNRYSIEMEWHSDDDGVYTMSEWCLLGMTRLNNWTKLAGKNIASGETNLHRYCQFKTTCKLSDIVNLLTRLENLDTTHLDRVTCINTFEYLYIDDKVYDKIVGKTGATASDVYDIVLTDPLKYTDLDESEDESDCDWRRSLSTLAKFIVNGDVVD